MSTGTEIAAVIERVIDRKVRRSKAGGPSRVTGKVVSVDPDGTTWVDLGGGVRATPASRTSVELAPGDSVSGTIEHGRLTIDGNLSDVSAGAGSVAEVKGSVSRLADAWKDVVAAAGETSENAKAAEEAAGKAEEAAEEATGKAEQAAADARTAEEKADEILAVTEPIIGEFEQVKELAKENAEKDAQVRDLMESSYARKTQLTEVNAYLKTWVKQSAASYKICAYYSAQGNITQSAKAALDAKKSTLDQAEASLESAIGTLNAANEDAETAYGNLDAAKALLNTAIANLASARALLQQKRDALARLDEDDPGYAQAAAEVEAAAADVAAAKASYDSAFAAVGRMKTALDTATAAVDSASSAVNRAVTQYQTALDGFTEEASACIEVAADAITSTVTGVTNLEATYATCSTAAGTAAKVAALENFRLRTGATVSVWFRYGNTVDENLTLAVNSTGAKTVLFNGGASPGDDVAAWAAGTVCEFVYDGTYWRFVACSNDAKRLATAETTIVQHAEDITLRATKAQLKAVYLTSTTAGSTQSKVANFVADSDDTAAEKLAAFDLFPGVEVSVKFTYKNTHSTPYLKIGDSGTAYRIMGHDGSALTERERTWGAGAIVNLGFDGTYWRLLDMGAFAYVDITANGIMSDVRDVLGDYSTTQQTSQMISNSVSGLASQSSVTQTASDLTTLIQSKGACANCSTSASTSAKTASTPAYASDSSSKDFSLKAGVTVSVRHTTANSASALTLNVNGTGAKTVRYNGAATSSTNKLIWAAGDTIAYTYDGTYWNAEFSESILRYTSDGTLVGRVGQGVAALVGSGGSFEIVSVTWSGRTPTIVNNFGKFYTDGLRVWDGSGTEIAHLGYGTGTNSSGGTSDAPYYTLGKRRTATASYSTSRTYNVGDVVLRDEVEYVCVVPIPTPESWNTGHWSRTVGNYSVAEGINTTASEYASHAEGSGTAAIGVYSHAEGVSCQATDKASHAEGFGTVSTGRGSHSEGEDTMASGDYSHAEGLECTASGDYSHAGGLDTEAAYDCQTAIGKYNSNSSSNVFEIGNGASTSNRSNAFAVDWNGRIHSSGYNKTLWSGASYYMTAGHTVNLSEPISTQANGIVLQWQAYVNGETQNYDYHYQYVPKSHVQSHEGAGVTTVMANVYFNPIGAKYVYISDNSITGNNENNTSGTSNGITYNNAHWVLTEVYGV